MKVYLTGPRKGRTENINGVQFIDGIADVVELTKYLSVYYKVSDVNPDGDVIQNSEPVKEVIPEEVVEDVPDVSKEEDSKELMNFIEAKKAEIAKQHKEEDIVTTKPTMEEFNAIKNFGKQKAYVFQHTGINPRNRDVAIRVLKEHGAE